MARILVVTSLYPPHHYGGYELTCAAVVKRWQAHGHAVSVLTSDWQVPGVKTEAADMSADNVRRSLRLYWDDHRLLSPSPLGRLRTERHNQSALRRMLREFQPDVVSLWQLAAVSLSSLA